MKTDNNIEKHNTSTEVSDLKIDKIPRDIKRKISKIIRGTLKEGIKIRTSSFKMNEGIIEETKEGIRISIKGYFFSGSVDNEVEKNYWSVARYNVLFMTKPHDTLDKSLEVLYSAISGPKNYNFNVISNRFGGVYDTLLESIWSEEQ